MSSIIPQELEPLFSVQTVIIYPMSTFPVMYFVYGIYVLLFGTYLYMVLNRGQKLSGTATTNRLYLRLTATLFVLATIFVAIYTVDLISYSILAFDGVKTGDLQSFIQFYTLDDVKGPQAVYSLEYLIPVLLNITAEWMLIHRCYTIWGSDKRIGVPLITASVILNATGLISAVVVIIGFAELKGSFSQAQTATVVYSIGSTVMNAILTLLTAGRIWWIHRQVRVHGIHTRDKMFQSVCRIILESGVIYPLFQIASLITLNTSSTTFFNLYPIATMSAGIAPNLIMVRAKLGKDVQSLQTGDIALSDIRVNDSRPGPGWQTQTISVGPGTVEP